MTRGKRAYPNHKKEHKKLIKFASRWHTLQIVQNEKITLRSHERENERMDMLVVEEEGDWEYTMCVENVK